jgi:hypothetical protein
MTNQPLVASPLVDGVPARSLYPVGASIPHVLLIGSDPALGARLGDALQPAVVRSVVSANDTEGLGVDIVVIAAEFPLYELTEVAVHPTLNDKPVVIYAPGRRFARDGSIVGNVRSITDARDPFAQLVDELNSLFA